MMLVRLLRVVLLVALVPGAAAAAGLDLSELKVPGRVLMLRHAEAPGTGDPPGFRLDDCSTQRNLDASGRAQARALGDRLRQAGIAQARVYSSQWCRCMETARLLALGPVEALPVLNSFYARPGEKAPRVEALRDFLARLPVDGGPVILVTHQFTINVFTDQGTPSGGGSVFALTGTTEPRWIGAIAAP
jgi:broad specificity phosphatase PhoE